MLGGKHVSCPFSVLLIVSVDFHNETDHGRENITHLFFSKKKKKKVKKKKREGKF